MKSLKLPWIIHIFALLHAVVALGCRYTGVDDELLLTVLTMALALVICMKKGVNVEFTAAIIIVMNILGFIIGSFGAQLLQNLPLSIYAAHAVSTAITTEILGWSVMGMTRLFILNKEGKGQDMLSSPYMKWVLLLALGVFILRLLIATFFSAGQSGSDRVFEMTRIVMSNSVALIMLVCINILYIKNILTRHKEYSKTRRTLSVGALMIGATTMEALLIILGLYVKDESGLNKEIPLLIAISFLTQITIYCIVYVVNYAITARHEMEEEREKANMAQYRYLKLKRQVNPHFLFNSLNILDCLICEEKTEQASTYTHKLAGIYRYMIKSEEEEIVPLRDELQFVEQYIDLLKIRFPEGFEVHIDVPEEKMSRFVPPCSIQLLIENATKHNAVGGETPLKIKVEAVEGCIRVSNNIIPKVTKSQSTGLGQKYIRQLYLDLSGKHITIDKIDGTYCVTLPLL